MGYKNKADKNAYERRRRAQKAIEAGRIPGKTGRPKMYGPPKPKHWNRGDRSEEYAKQNARSRAMNKAELEAFEAAMRWPYDDPIINQAVEFANSKLNKDKRTYVYDPVWEDLVCEVVLAIIEGRDIEEAAAEFKKYTNGWKARVNTGMSDNYYNDLLEIKG